MRLGGKYQTKVVIKNEDILQQRVTIKQPKLDTIKAVMNSVGPIAMGLSRELVVTFSPNIVGYIRDELQIVSKNQIYTIPILADVLNQESYAALVQQQEGQLLLKTNIVDLSQEKGIDVVDQGGNESIISDKLPKIKNQSGRLHAFQKE